MKNMRLKANVARIYLKYPCSWCSLVVGEWVGKYDR